MKRSTWFDWFFVIADLIGLALLALPFLGV